MRRPVVITAPFATPEDVARIYGIPKRRAKQLRRMVEESLAKKGYLIETRKDSTIAKNGADNRESGSHRFNVTFRGNGNVKSKSGNTSRRKTARAKAKTSR